MLPEQDRVPPYVVGRGPDYVVVGGLVFQELTRPYLATWGDWARRAPPRLSWRSIGSEGAGGRTPGRIVLLSSVLPDAANLGYQDLRDLIVERVNGRPVGSLADLRAAFARPRGRLPRGRVPARPGAERIVLDVAEADAAGERLHRAYGVEKLDSDAR